MTNRIGFRNTYRLRGWDRKTGSLLWTREYTNLVTTQGLNYVLNTLFGAGTGPSWYMGLIDNASFSALAATDTTGQINGTNGWKEAQQYSQTTRPILVLSTSTSASINNSGSPCIYTCNSNFTLYGAFVASSGVKGGTAGVLFGEAPGSNGSVVAPQAVTSGQMITGTVTITAESAA